MRPLLLAALFAVSIAAAYAQPVPQRGCNAVGRGPSRVAAAFVAPQGCCIGRLKCAQFLSTNTVVRPQREQHT